VPWYSPTADTTRNFQPIGVSDGIDLEAAPGFGLRTVVPVEPSKVVPRPALVEMERVFAQPEITLLHSDGGFEPAVAPPVTASRSFRFLPFATRSKLFPDSVRARLDTAVPMVIVPSGPEGKPRPRPSFSSMVQPLQLDRPAVAVYPGPEFEPKKLTPSPLALKDQPLGSTDKVGASRRYGAALGLALLGLGVAVWMSRN
jgi:hypothetical protein